MKKTGKQGSLLLVMMVALIGVILSNVDASAELTAKANHDHIKIDFFYHGSTVSVRGVSEPDTDLIIKIASPDGHETLKQKGKTAGILWMNVGTLNFENVPTLFTVHSTRNISDMLSPDEATRHVVSYTALEKHADISPVANDADKDKWFDEFVMYKESSRLYKTSVGQIKTELKDGKQEYYILTDWPYQAPPGEYTVTVYAVKDMKVIETAEAKVLVEQIGIVNTLSDMAKRNGALYGMISIISALGAGFGVGLIFRKGGGAH